MESEVHVVRSVADAVSNTVCFRGPERFIDRLWKAIDEDNEVFNFNEIMPLPHSLTQELLAELGLVEKFGKIKRFIRNLFVDCNKENLSPTIWCIVNWGTKLSGQELIVLDYGPNHITVNFKTVMTPPTGIFERLEKRWSIKTSGASFHTVFDELEIHGNLKEFHKNFKLINEEVRFLQGDVEYVESVIAVGLK